MLYNISMRKEVMKLEDRIFELALVAISVISAEVLGELVDWFKSRKTKLKKKAPKHKK